MNQSTVAPNTALSATTNFDLPSLHILLAEIETALTDAENHLSEFYDDEEQVSLLMDSVTVIEQLSSIFELIDLKGASDLSAVIAKTLKKLHDSGDNSDTALVMDISEGIMLLDRYVEFVLLKEVVEPSLLLPIINKLRQHIGETPLSADEVASGSIISITNPEQHYQSLASLGLNAVQLTAIYRAGLGVALTKESGLSDGDIAKLNAMSSACQTIAERSDTLFWNAAAILTQNLANQLPLSNAKKRVLIYIEQQFQDYLPIHDRRFADLVGFACDHNKQFAQIARQKYALGKLSDSQYHQMNRFLFGPNREITDTLNLLIQGEIGTIKEKVDGFSRGDTNINALTTTEIAAHIKDLSSTLHLLGLNEAADALLASANKVKTWTSPTPDELDGLLADLMVAENASIFLAKTHTPGAVKLPLHNRSISLHQLDTAYATLIKESRTNIAMLNQVISDYLTDEKRELMHLQNAPEMLQQVAGATSFLGLNDSAKMLATLAKFMEIRLTEHNTETLSSEVLANIADVIVAADYYLESQEENRPVSKQAVLIGQHSLSRVLNTLS